MARDTPARGDRVAHRLVDPELARDEDVLLPGPAAADPDGADDDGGAVEDVAAVDGGRDLRRPVGRLHVAPDHLLGGLEDHRVDVDERDLPVALRPLLDPVDDDALREHGAAGADQDHLLLRGLRLVPGDRDVPRARHGALAGSARREAAQGNRRRRRHETLHRRASIHGRSPPGVACSRSPPRGTAGDCITRRKRAVRAAWSPEARPADEDPERPYSIFVAVRFSPPRVKVRPPIEPSGFTSKSTSPAVQRSENAFSECATSSSGT